MERRGTWVVNNTTLYTYVDVTVVELSQTERCGLAVINTMPKLRSWYGVHYHSTPHHKYRKMEIGMRDSYTRSSSRRDLPYIL
jgi:hypothetical protein